MRPREPQCDAGGNHPKELAVNGNGNNSLPFLSTAVFPMTLKFEEVVYKVKTGNAKEKTILNGVTGMVCPGEMLAMLGPSGSGKTTLLTALGGRLPAKNLCGKITYNGLPFSAAARRRTGFVAQDNVLYPHLTVTETLIYTALLRLPRINIDMPLKLERILEWISPDSKLELDKTNADEGGQYNAVRDQLISAYDHHIASRLKVELFNAETINCITHNPHSGIRKAAKEEQWTTTWFEQFTVLLRRSLKERRHEAFNKLRIFQVLSVAILGGLLWWQTPPSHLQDKVTNHSSASFALKIALIPITNESNFNQTALIFFFSVFWGFFPLYNAVFTFPQERAMLLKERASGMYRLSSYFMARTVGDLPMELALPTAFTFIFYWMGGLDPRPASFLLSLLVVLYSVLVAQSLGLAFGAILMEVKQATTLASVTTLTFLIAGGYYVQHIPPFIVWLKYLSYSFYCFKLLVGVQFRPNDTYECSNGLRCSVLDFPAIKSVGLDLLWLDVLIMGLMLVGYRFIAYWALHKLQRPR
ncbi:ABC transporter G family member 14 [Dendrobium catenatum]|uniref:ABC transporter G family member 14 n=1 Tax=Dendrobium catenatum TaxID=906689 RepID=A0A2I0WDB0_9ASPA|nr:ABC transporter G family member 14 [Dendrobium catenatum]